VWEVKPIISFMSQLRARGVEVRPIVTIDEGQNVFKSFLPHRESICQLFPSAQGKAGSSSAYIRGGPFEASDIVGVVTAAIGAFGGRPLIMASWMAQKSASTAPSVQAA